MVSTPCLAGVGIEGLFSVDGTLWSACGIGFISIPPFVSMGCESENGFYHGMVYSCYKDHCDAGLAYYVDLGVVSIAYNIALGFPDGVFCFLAIMQPIGLGVFSAIVFAPMLDSSFALGYKIGIMYKINDNWTPPGLE